MSPLMRSQKHSHLKQIIASATKADPILQQVQCCLNGAEWPDIYRDLVAPEAFSPHLCEHDMTHDAVVWAAVTTKNTRLLNGTDQT